MKFKKGTLVFLSYLLLKSSVSYSGQLAYEEFGKLHVSGVLHNKRQTKVIDAKNANWGVVSYGAEKEGSDSSLIYAMGPNVSRFKHYVKSLGTPLNRSVKKRFLQKLMKGMFQGDYAVRNVKSWDDGAFRGKIMDEDIDYKYFGSLNYDKMNLSQIYGVFKEWLKQTNDRPFSFIRPEIRKEIYEAKFVPGTKSRSTIRNLGWEYKEWVPHFGIGEKYILDALPAVDFKVFHSGWEIRFNPLKSYGEFEGMLSWFKDTMSFGGKDKEVTAPGHQRMVYPEMNLPKHDLYNMKLRISEMYRHIQALITLRGISGKTGIMNSSWKKILSDETMKDLKSWKGVVRLERDRWAKGTQGIELRAGTKDEEVQKFMEKIIATRVSTNDWDEIVPIDQWKLVPNGLDYFKMPGSRLAAGRIYSRYASRFGVSTSEMKTFIKRIKKIEPPQDKKAKQDTDLGFLVPLWHWENAPYITNYKKELIRSLTKDLIQYIANKPNITFDDISGALSEWVKVSKLSDDIMDYLRPKGQIDDTHLPIQLMEKGTNTPSVFNDVPLQISVNGEFPLKAVVRRTDKKEVGRKVWLTTMSDLSIEEKKEVLRKFSMSLMARLDSQGKKLIFDKCSDEQVEFQIKLGQGQVWKVSWKGMLQSYNAVGEVAEKSLRQGYINVTSSNSKISQQNIVAIYDAFKEYNISTSSDLREHQISFDGKVFNQNPAKLANFIKLTQHYRPIMSYLFQSAERLKKAYPVNLTPSFIEYLDSFDGSMIELKEMLYNEGFFNKFITANPSNAQIDFTSFIQDVIPDNLKKQDPYFNMNPANWERGFVVNEGHRLININLFDVAQDAYEASLQVKFVKALIKKSMEMDNRDKYGQEEIDYSNIEKNKNNIFNMFEKMMEDLGLDSNEYIGMLGNNIENIKMRLGSSFHKSIKKLNRITPKVSNWGKAKINFDFATDAIENADEEQKVDDYLSKRSKNLEIIDEVRVKVLNKELSYMNAQFRRTPLK